LFPAPGTFFFGIKVVQEPENGVMSTYFFKTNINCIECVDRVKPQLDKLEQAKSIDRWHLDLNNPDYVLEIETNKLSPEEVKHLIGETGFNATLTQPSQP
jgi:copper chaperone